MQHFHQQYLILGLMLVLSVPATGQVRFKAKDGYVHFTSDAPLELIQATSQQLSGILEPGKSHFAFAVNIRSFEGFNSPLQREHFNENYLESRRFPRATFTGRIIEDIDFTAPGNHEVRAKGHLEIHGIKQERIIKGRLLIGPDQIRISTAFSVLLTDHEISIPQIVYQKIAEEILIEIDIKLKPITTE